MAQTKQDLIDELDYFIRELVELRDGLKSRKVTKDQAFEECEDYGYRLSSLREG